MPRGKDSDALLKAVKSGEVDTVRQLLEGGTPADCIDGEGFSLLHHACRFNDDRGIVLLDVLLQYKADPNLKDVHKFTPLHWAASKGSAEMCDKLLACSALVNEKDEYGFTPMHWAANKGYEAIAKSLLEKNAQLDVKDENGLTPLHWAAREMLVKSTALLELQDEFGMTPLQCAAFKGREKVTQLLVLKGANVNSKNKKGSAPLHGAASEGYELIAGFLVKHGADVNAQNTFGVTPLHWGARRGHHRVVAVLIQKGAALNLPAKDGNTPLHYSCMTGHNRASLVLLQENADMNIGNDDGNTPLHLAIKENHEKIVRLLVEHNADPNLQNDAGQTPVHLACQEGRDQLLVIMQEKLKADIYVRDNEGRTPLAIVKTEQQRKTMKQMYDLMQLPPQGSDLAKRALKARDVYKINDQVQEVADKLKREKLDEDMEARDPGSPSTPATVEERIGEKPAEWEIEYEELELGKLVGKGGYGEVYRGYWRGTEVAVKKLLVQKMEKKHLKEFKHEINLMSKLRHPNEFLTRGSLFAVLRDRTIRYDWALMKKMALDAAKGMNYLHCSKPPIIHRDLKSLNLLVDDNMNVKVCDFGLTKVKERSYMLTRVGTPQWMAPEVLRNEHYDEKADVFSFGCVLWELYTRQDPYKGMNAMEVGRKVVAEGLRLPIPQQCPPVLSDLMKACWEDDATLRPSFKVNNSIVYDVIKQQILDELAKM